MNLPLTPRPIAWLSAALCAAVLTLAPYSGGFGVATPAQAQDAGARAELTKRIEKYLNSIETLRARFLQIGPAGEVARGTVLISRPGKLRIEYDPPSPVLILTQGSYLMLYDKELDSRSYASLSDTLAGFLVRPEIRLSGDIEVRDLHRSKGVIRVTLVKADSPDSGRLTLVFSDDPLRLRQWVVVDEQGGETRVALEDPRFNIKLDRDAFEYTFPEPDEPFGEQ